MRWYNWLGVVLRGFANDYDTIATVLEKQSAELRIKSEWISTRQCPDHSGKWPRGTCLQCEVERLAKLELPASLYHHMTEVVKAHGCPSITEMVVEVKQLRARFDDWTPTAENVNALPDPIRKYIADLETDADPAGTIREKTILQDTCKGQEEEIDGLRNALNEAYRMVLDKDDRLQDYLSRVV